jgi:dTDP-4-amino-4,6-dideoxygalactose transaminase
VTLPLFPAMQAADVERVVEATDAILRGARR